MFCDPTLVCETLAGSGPLRRRQSVTPTGGASLFGGRANLNCMRILRHERETSARAPDLRRAERGPPC